jgi:membrane-associated protein
MLPGVDLRELLTQLGYVGLFAMIFLESCLLFFLPGDSPLFLAGFMSSPGAPEAIRIFSAPVLVVSNFVAAIAGNSVGYFIGQKVGSRLFSNPNSKLFQPRHLEKVHAFYEEHGGKTIVWARFLPVIRTFAPVVAGMGAMSYPRFLLFNVVGGLLWVGGMVGGGYVFGSILPPEAVDRYLIPVILLIIVLSLAPTAYHLWQERRGRH